MDVIFENVGGIILDAGLMNLNQHSRVGLCGLISEYNTEPRGIRNLWQSIVKRAHIRGLLVADYVPRFGEGAAQMGVWASRRPAHHLQRTWPTRGWSTPLTASCGNRLQAPMTAR